MNPILQNKPQPPLSYAFPRFNVEWEKPAFLIKPSYAQNGINCIEFDSFIFFMEQIVRSVIPEELLSVLSSKKSYSDLKEKIALLNELLPLVRWNAPMKAPSTLCVRFLCPADFTSGVGRYLCDTLSRWLVPGKFLNITSAQSLNFKFIAFPEQSFFVQQLLLDINDENELMVVRNNQENLTKEMRLNTIAVKHARHVIAIKKLSSEQKKIIIEENIASILERPSKTFDQNVFDQMHHFLVHLSAEDKITQIKDQFAPFMQQRPKVFDRDIFNEIKHFVLLFYSQFTALRDLRHVGRIISYQYLFRKSLQREVLNFPGERHVSIKLMKAHLSDPSSKKGKTVLGILGGINVLSENEMFEERHVTEALEHCLPDVKKVEDSFIIDRRSHDPIRIFYIEIEKENNTYFNFNEIRELRKHLPRELKGSIESIIHPVFMPRNEEEIMRNIVILSQQLKYIHDIPQVIITFDMQTEEELTFTVILLRLLKQSELSIPEIFQQARTELKLQSHEVKQVGILRKKYIKEANVFSVSVDKKQFLRKDYSLDLFRARQDLSSELHRILGGIRDFNGGILSKQQEVFQELRDSISDSNVHQDFLLENFFYSLSPPLRQSLLQPAILKKLFNMQLEALDTDYTKESFFLKAYADENHLLLMAASPHGDIKNELISSVTALQIPSSDLSFTHISAYGINCIGYIYQSHNIHQRTVFYDSIHDSLHQWKAQIKK